MRRRPPRSTRTDTLFPYTTLFRSWHVIAAGRAALAAKPDARVAVLTRNLKDFNRSELRHLGRSEEHTSELQSLMRISYAVFCLKKKKSKNNTYNVSY